MTFLHFSFTTWDTNLGRSKFSKLHYCTLSDFGGKMVEERKQVAFNKDS